MFQDAALPSVSCPRFAAAQAPAWESTRQSLSFNTVSLYNPQLGSWFTEWVSSFYAKKCRSVVATVTAQCSEAQKQTPAHRQCGVAHSRPSCFPPSLDTNV